MKQSLCLLLAGGLSLLFAPGRAVERVPIEVLARDGDMAQARLSPDGRRLAFTRPFKGRATLHILDLDQGNLSRLDLGEAMLVHNAPKEVGRFTWIGNERLVVTTLVWGGFYGVLATNWNGAAEMPLSGYEDNKVSLIGPKLSAREVIYSFRDKDQTILMLDRHEGGGGSPARPDILRVDTMTGQASTLVENPGEVASWGLDFNGVARLGILAKDHLSGAIYRASDKDEWKTILPLQNRMGQMRPAGFDAANNRVLVTALNRDNRWTIFPLNPVTGEMGQPLLSDPEYDIVPGRALEGIGGVALARTIFSERKQALVGVRYATETQQIKWFDREFASYQAFIDKSLPDTVNLFVDQSLDGKRLLWFCFSDQDPGAYFLLDLEKHSLRSLGPVMKEIKPALMAPMLAVKYAARDGLVIHGYLTVPVGHEPKGLPLVVMPHGGPWARDVWGFNPLVQLLASRGYAVLQMNYRGSLGYGEELFREARREIGGKIQDDIEDATRWAISAGVADPKHIAIMGSSYGGYSALFALGHNPELYRCGISHAGVTDWPAIFDRHRGDSDYKASNRFWRNEIGDPDKDGSQLATISPVNFAGKITAPVLIIQGKEDRTVPPDQARRMITALEKAGHPPTSLFLSDVGHNFGQEKQRTEIFRSIVNFLEKNLGPGVQ